MVDIKGRGLPDQSFNEVMIILSAIVVLLIVGKSNASGN
jgi:hypothetical protein